MRTPRSGPELLESRIALALAFALDANNTLLSFDLAEPDEVLTSQAISGLAGGETLLGMDFRPRDGNLYAISSGQRLYVIDPGNGQATLVATLAADPTDLTSPFTAFTGSSFGVDFNPVVDLIRVVSDSGENFRVNPNTGLTTTDGSLAFAPTDPNVGAVPAVTGAGYTNSFSGATSTTLFALDTTQNSLVVINPPNSGTLLTVGSLGFDPEAATSFDIAPNSTDAYAIMTVTGVTGLYKLNLGSGAASFEGTIGSGAVGTRGLVILPGNLTLTNARTATYVDADGDRVSVKLSKGELGAGDFRLIARGPEGAQLATLNLSDDGGEFEGAEVVIKAAKVKKGADGDRFVNVGEILADVDLKTVSVGGDLGRIRAGDNDFDNNKGVGLRTLAVHSLGVYGTETGAQSILSTVSGDLTKVIVKKGFAGSLAVSGLDGGNIGAVQIGRSLYGGDENSSGLISATGEIGRITIGGDLRSGDGDASGRISAGTLLKSVTIKGSLVGGDDQDGPAQPQIESGGNIGQVKITRDVVGGSAGNSGSILASGDISTIKIGGSVLGGDGFQSGEIRAIGKISNVTIKGDMIGGDGGNSGSLQSSGGAMSRLKIGGALIGAEGGYFNEGGGSDTVAVSGPVIDRGAENLSSQVYARDGIRILQIGEGMIGGDGFRSGSVGANGFIRSAQIGGSIVGGDGTYSGVLSAEGYLSVRIAGNVVGGGTSRSGAVYSSDDVGGISIAGSLLGGTADATGRVVVEGALRTLTIKGDIRGGTDESFQNGLTRANPFDTFAPGSISAQSLGTVTIGGSITAAKTPGLDTAVIVSSTTIGQLKIKGDITGSADSAVVIVAGSTPDDARKSTTIGKVDIGGTASHFNLLAGFSSLENLTSGAAEIGKVSIKGDLLESNIVAGVAPGDDGFWGTADDAVGAQTTSSRIASVIIKGQAAGTAEAGDQFGIVAQAIGKVQVGTVKLTIPKSVTDPVTTIGWSEDVTIRVDV